MPIGSRKLRKDKGISRGSYSSYLHFWKHEKHESVVINGKQKLKLPQLDILNFLFRYDSESGKLFKIRGSNGKLCNPAREITTVNNKGYLIVGIRDSSGLKKSFLVHHICYFMQSGVEPLSIVDHKNGNPLDNRFGNLRLATGSENNRNRGMSRNNTSGICGVYWQKQKGKWEAQAYGNTGKRKYLGVYEDKEEAARIVSAYYANPENNYSDRHGL